MAQRSATRDRRYGDQSWDEWREQLPRSHVGPYPIDTLGALVVLEQLMWRSAGEQRCAECGEPGTVRIDRTKHSLIQSVSHYWFCADCDAYWKDRAARERAG